MLLERAFAWWLVCSGRSVAGCVFGACVEGRVAVVMAEVPWLVGMDELAAACTSDGACCDAACFLRASASVCCVVDGHALCGEEFVAVWGEPGPEFRECFPVRL